MSYKRIESLDQLKTDCADVQKDYFIWFGAARSSKTIEYNTEDEVFYIFNNIDDTEQILPTKMMEKETNIIRAIKELKFYSYETKTD